MHDERDVYSVSRLNREARALLERGFGLIWLEGEISNFARPSSGHWYFSLKDAAAQVRCAMFRQRNSMVRFVPRDGQMVLVRARVGLYEPRGEYQLIVDHVEDAGVGALQREFEQLAARLSAEGLFDTARKRPLPRLPRRIGVITSPTGAALRDILHVLARRFPAAAVLLYPVPVQGAQAAAEIRDALRLAASRAECDVLILARGGGSLEDLWAFNDESLARAIVASPIPVVTGVGHEVDFTIADLAADVRAPTPSAAAELVVPDREEWTKGFAALEARLAQGWRRRLRDSRERLGWLAGRAAQAGPAARLASEMQRLDELEQRLRRSLRQSFADLRSEVAEQRSQLWRASPAVRLREAAVGLGELRARLRAAGIQRLRQSRERLLPLVRTLRAVSPLATLDRGYAIVAIDGGGIVREPGDAPPGTRIEARLARGRIRATVDDPNRR
ncbi:MAG TPA: exodeoxyribonuclease VII large subunit [Steroidobacteraceae bacterium]|nr:exodeoxyribonuclease VII large subunit [Steroidobacteraceae bacterium]